MSRIKTILLSITIIYLSFVLTNSQETTLEVQEPQVEIKNDGELKEIQKLETQELNQPILNEEAHEQQHEHSPEHQEEEKPTHQEEGHQTHEENHEQHQSPEHQTKDGEQHQSEHGAEHQTEHGAEGHSGHGESTKLTPEDPEFYFSLFMSIFLVCFAGICSGLTVGYLSIDDLALEIKQENGTEADKKAAKAIIPILKDHHILLCTLLLSNAIAMEALPIFLDTIVPAYLAVIISTLAVVVVGEIIPQAYCTGPDQLLIAERMAPMINLLIKMLKPFTYCIAKGLDRLLGIHEKKRYNNEEMKNLVSLYESLIPKCLNCQINVKKQTQDQGIDFKCKKCEQDKVRERTFFQCDHKCYGQIICTSCYESNVILYETEVKAFKSVLENIEVKEPEDEDGEEKKQEELVKHKLISERQGFVPIKKVVMVDSTDKIDRQSIKKITQKMYSQILVRDPKINDLVGFVKVKNLIPYFDSDTNIEFKERMYTKIAYVNDDDNFLHIIDKFKNNQANIAVVLCDKGKASRANSLSNMDKREQEKEDIDVAAYSSLAPFNKNKVAKKPKKLATQVLEHEGKKILGIFTLKDVFENLIDVDFGESNVQDQIFIQKFEEAKNQDILEQATIQNTKSILEIMGNTSSQSNTRLKSVVKAANKFMKGKSKNLQEIDQSNQEQVRIKLDKQASNQKAVKESNEEYYELNDFNKK